MGLVQCSFSGKNSHYEEVRKFLRHWKVIGPEDEATVVINGITFLIDDIGLRMLRPRELFTANGFPARYIIDPIHNGKPLSITSQVKKCGNSVPPQFARTVISSNYCPPTEAEKRHNQTDMPAMPSRRCESCHVWETTCSVLNKITPFGPCHEAALYNKAQGVA
jgi:DNA (cytosine-5)-methyltransferase 1